MIKKIILAVFMTSIFMSCESKKEVSKEESNVSYAKFGDSISSENAMTNSEMMEKFASLKEGDTLSIKFKSSINEVGKAVSLFEEEKKEGKTDDEPESTSFSVARSQN